MIEEEEIAQFKANKGDEMLSSNAYDDDEEEENQLVTNQKGNLATPLKPKNIFKMMEADEV